MSKLKIKMDVYDRVVAMEVLEQCDSITCMSEYDEVLSYRASNGITITSDESIALTRYVISIRGYRNVEDSDNSHWDYCVFNSKEEANMYKNIYLTALREWASNGYFNAEVVCNESVDSEIVFEF